MKDVLREIGMIARSLDSISNIEFKQYDLTKDSICTSCEYVNTQELFKKSYLK